MVYISFPTEQGTLYTKRELCDISAVCKKYGMYLFVDGARMGYGLGSDKMTLHFVILPCFRMFLYRWHKVWCALWRSAGYK